MNLIKLRKIGIRGVLLLALLVFLTACPGDEPKPVETNYPAQPPKLIMHRTATSNQRLAECL